MNTESEKVHFIHLVPYSNGKPKLCTENNDIVFLDFLQIFSICNIAIDIAALIYLHDLDHSMEPQEKFIYFPPGVWLSVHYNNVT